MAQSSIVAVKTAGQIRDVAELAHQIWTEHYTPIIGANQVEYMLNKFQNEKAISNQIADGFLYFLIEDDSKLGYLSIKAEKQCLFISKIYVLNSKRGKGHGKKLMLKANHVANDLGLKKLRLTVNKYNKHSIDAYRKMGFFVAREVVFDIGNGFVMDDYEMIKGLD